MALGWAFYREPFGLRETMAMVVVFLGVAVVKWTAAHAPSKHRDDTAATSNAAAAD
jgi:drug/metabolite transporter (DMT)-like permease